MCGVGKMEWADGSVYNGEFVDGMMHGPGHIIYENKDTYTGDFANDFRHGTGTYYNSTKMLERTGEWEEGVELNPPADSRSGQT